MIQRLIFATLMLWSSSVRADAVDDAVETEIKRQSIPGISLATIEDGRVTRLAGYGKATVEHDVSVTPDTVFQAGSIAKQFTAISILMLERDGKLSVNDSVAHFFPDAPKAWSGIKLRHLLSHTAGISDNDSLFALQTNPDSVTVRKLVWKNPLYAKPGASFRYSNMAYVLLGHVIEKVTRKPYHAFIDTRILGPLAMTSSRGISDRAIIPNRASGYEMADNRLLNQDWVAPAFNSTADGSSYTSARDFARYLAAMDTPSSPLAPYFDQISNPTPLTNGLMQPYGMGWFLAKVSSVPIQYHSGTWQGFRAMAVHYPAQKKSIILLTNSNVTDVIALAAAIIPLAFPGLPPPPLPGELKPYSDGK